MTKIKFCGLKRKADIETANALNPDYIGFVFAKNSRRYISPENAAVLKSRLSPEINAVGVFVNERPEAIASLLNDGVIDLAQLHGDEGEAYINRLKGLTGKPVIKAFRITSSADVQKASASPADLILLDSGTGSGRTFNWQLIQEMRRPYFLAGGLDPVNVRDAVRLLNPWAVDVSSGIETDGFKDIKKMAAFAEIVRKTSEEALSPIKNSLEKS